MTGEGDLRGALRGARLTLVLVTLLLSVYVLEVVVWLSFGWEAVVFAFLATAEPSPGWVLAPFAHSLREPLHLLTSIVVVAVYGGLVEARLRAAAYLQLYVLAGYASTAVVVTSYALTPGSGTFGASGAAMALVGFLVVDTAMRLVAGEATTVGERVFATTGVAIVVLRMARDFGVVVPAAEGTAPLGHAAGVLVGVGYAVWRAARAARARPDPGL